MIVVLDRMDMVGKTCVITMINEYTKTRFLTRIRIKMPN